MSERSSNDRPGPDDQGEREAAEFGEMLRASWAERDEFFSRAPDDLATVPEAAAAIGLTDDQLRQKIAAGEVEHRLIDGEPRITIAEARRYHEDLKRRRNDAMDAITKLSNEIGFFD